MKSALKVVLPLGLLLAVVFAVTFFSVNTPKEEVTPDKTDGKDVFAGGKGLVFFTTMRRWDPASESLADQAFPGFYEPGETTHATHFWFENRNTGPITFKLLGVSCSSCSGGRVAAIPPDAIRQLLQMAAVSAVPLGPVAACPPGMAGAAAVLDAKLAWQAHSFKDGTAEYQIPGAADTDGWSPSWGVLELNFKVRPNGQVPLKAAFGSYREDGTPIARDDFAIFYEPAPAFEVDKTAIEAGVLADNTPAQAHSVLVYSAARGPDELAGLVARVVNPGADDPGPFVTAGPLVPVPPADLDRIAATLSAKAGRPVRVRSAFRFPVEVAAKKGDARADIGRLEREVWVSSGAAGSEPKRISVRGTVTGPVSLAGAGEVNLGTFSARQGANDSVVVTTEQAGVELAVVPGGARPDYLDVSLTKLSDAGGRGQWQLTVRVPPGRVSGELTGGLVVLELRGPTPVRVRVPVKGRGLL
jgi:hypothetical protein